MRLADQTRAQRNESAAAPLGAAIRARRIARGWSVADFARQSGIASCYLSRIETGRVLVRPGTLLTLSRALGVTPAQFLEETMSAREAIEFLEHAERYLQARPPDKIVRADNGATLIPRSAVLKSQEKARAILRDCMKFVRWNGAIS